MKRILALLALCTMGVAAQAVEWACPGWIYDSHYNTKAECDKKCSKGCVIKTSRGSNGPSGGPISNCQGSACSIRNTLN